MDYLHVMQLTRKQIIGLQPKNLRALANQGYYGKQIAKKLGLVYSLVQARMKEYGIKKRKSKSVPEL